MGWSYLAVAVVLEIGWASSLKWTDGYTRLVPSLINFSLSIANVFFPGPGDQVSAHRPHLLRVDGSGIRGHRDFCLLVPGENLRVGKNRLCLNDPPRCGGAQSLLAQLSFVCRISGDRCSRGTNLLRRVPRCGRLRKRLSRAF